MRDKVTNVDINDHSSNHAANTASVEAQHQVTDQQIDYFRKYKKIKWLHVFAMYEFFFIIIYKFLVVAFHQRDVNEVDEKLMNIIFVQAAINCMYILVLLCQSYWRKLMSKHLCDAQQLGYPMLMLLALCVCDLLIAFDYEESHYFMTYFAQMFCDLGYIPLFLYIPQFMVAVKSYKQKRFSVHYGCLIVDIIMYTIVILIIFSVFVLMVYTDLNIDHIVHSAYGPMIARIVIENFLILEWIHQLLEYVWIQHDSHHQPVDIFTLYKPTLTIADGLSLAICCYKPMSILLKIVRPEGWLSLQQSEHKQIIETAYYIFTVGIIPGLLFTLFYLLNIFIYLAEKFNVHKMYQYQMPHSVFPAFLWMMLLLLGVSYANIQNAAYYFQIVTDLLWYPLEFAYIFSVMFYFENNCRMSKMILGAFVVLVVSNIVTLTVNVYNDVHTMEEFKSTRLVFMIFVVQNTIILEELHMLFPIMTHHVVRFLKMIIHCKS
eukprot:413616_1